MSKIIRGIYAGKFPSGTLHLDDGKGKPLCYSFSRGNHSVEWIQVEASNPTCTLCEIRLRAIQRVKGWKQAKQ